MYQQLLGGKIRVDFRDVVLPNGARGSFILPVPNEEVLGFFSERCFDAGGGQWNWVECYPTEWVEFLTEAARAIHATNEGRENLGMIRFMLDEFKQFTLSTRLSSFKGLDELQRWVA
ncbi:hypothetical protein BAC2_00626 [uncultured bacterium]|nr:hypothetical protein BAC2_00626 [uncultured bacterium]